MGSSRDYSMAKRSDFAQKLLDDLRLRKEQLAASQRSNHANSIAADKHAYLNRIFKGSKEIKTQNTGFQNGKVQNRYNGGNTPLTIGDVSNQIVPFGRGQCSEKIDLSTALAFALENVGKATRLDPSGNTSIISFLHQIGKRSMDYGKMERRRNSIQMHQPTSSNLPMIQLHVKEISKGTQKLNQIIKAFANGHDLGTFSIEYGKELMKGAIDLEQSLRMLVEIQEGSEYMVSHPQRKNKIKLLNDDGDEEDDYTDKRNEQKQLELPRFSSNKPCRNYQDIQEYASSDIKMRLSALSYHPGVANINHGKQNLANSRASSHRRSVSCSTEINGLPRFSEQNNQSSPSQAKAGKGRIPNVIAKLMGLGELPEEEDSSKYNKQNNTTLKTKTRQAISSNTTVSGTKKTEHRRKDTDQASHNIKQKVTQANKVAALENLVALQEGKKFTSKNIAFDVAIHDETQAWKDLSNKMRSQKDIWEKEREQGTANHWKRKDEEKGETKELIFKDELQRTITNMHGRPEAAAEFHKGRECKVSAPLTEDNHTNNLLSRSQQKPLKNLSFEQQLVVQKPDPRETKHHTEERTQNREKEKLQLGKHKGNASIPNLLPKPLNSSDVKKKQSHTNKATANRKSSPEANDVIQTEKSPEGSNQKCKAGDASYTLSQVNMKDPNHKFSSNISSPKDLGLGLARADKPPAKEEKPVHTQAAQKAKEVKLHKSEIPQKINDVMTRRNGSLNNLSRTLKHQSSSLQQVKDGRKEKPSSSKETNQIRTSKSKEAGACTITSTNSVTNIQPSNKNIVKAESEVKQDQLFCTHGEDQRQSLKELQSPTSTNSCQAILLVDKNDQHAPESISDSNEALKSDETVTRMLNGAERKLNISLASVEQQKLPKQEIQELLSESENNLKKILIKSQLFLDTAEALFKLNIPLGILHADGHVYNQEDSNLILDCGYEIMKRKGRRQELSIHPFVKVPIISEKVKSLNNLIKQLNKEFEKLKSYGRDSDAEPVVEDYLPKMLEKDVQYSDPDLNCMWDMGWNDLMFAFIEKDDVIRDVERHVLNRLVDEITRDLVCI